MVDQLERAQTHAGLDAAVAELRERKDRWARLPAAKKIPYLVRMRRTAGEVAERWVRAAAEAKGIPAGSPLAGEEWMSGPWALTFALNRLIETMRAVARGDTPPLKPGAVRTRAGGQVVVDVFPLNLYDTLLVNGVTAEVWMQPGVTPENLAETMAVFYKRRDPEGKVALVLGAGNIASIPPLDALYKLYAEGSVCLLKMNPVNSYLGPFLEDIFAPLIADGYLRVAYGGTDVGEYLCAHPGVDELHMTGSDKTHDAIVFGTGAEGAARKRADTPLNSKPMSSELGNVSPTIVVPGPWSEADFRFQAEHIATQKMHNGGFNCIAAQVLVMPEGWEGTPTLLQTVRDTLRDLPPRDPYYPGAAGRRQAFVAAHPEAETLDPPGVDVSRTLIPDVGPGDRNDVCFRTEAFAGVLAETTLPGADAATFLRNAVTFCNDTLWGTLGANILTHPKTARELGPAFEQAVADLRYGCVAVNAWTGVGFLLAQTSWGAYPGHARDDIGSGVGVVHNTFLFDRPQKSVVRAPFAPFPRSVATGEWTILPKPPWFVTNKQAHNVGRRLVQFEVRPGMRHLPGIFADALRG